MIPRARQTGLLVRAVGEQVVVYDQERRRVHVLNRTAALIWRNCDGQLSIASLAALVGRELDIAADENVIWLTLARLQKARLLEGQVVQPPAVAALPRRELLRRVTGAVVARALVPTILSIAPMAQLVESVGATPEVTSAPTLAPTTAAPTFAPTTKAPTTAAPTLAPTTVAPTLAPTTKAPTTAAPTTTAPTTQAPTTFAPTTKAPTTQPPTTAALTTTTTAAPTTTTSTTTTAPPTTTTTAAPTTSTTTPQPQVPTATQQVRGVATYGDGTVTLTATVVRQDNSQPVPGVGMVTFTFQGTVVGSVGVDNSGIATLTLPLPPGTQGGTYAKAVRAEYGGTAVYLPSAGTGPLKVERLILLLKPADQTVKLKQPNPTGSTLELANGSHFINGDGWSSLNLTNLRFTYSRNYPASNATEVVGKTYKISATGASSISYDLRYLQGTLTVVS